jgi:hypothetical protein
VPHPAVFRVRVLTFLLFLFHAVCGAPATEWRDRGKVLASTTAVSTTIRLLLSVIC